MKKISVFMNKELKRFISDKRMMLSVIMPGILVFLIYSLIGNFMFSQESQDGKYQVIVCNMPECLGFIKDMEEFEIKDTEYEKSENSFDRIKKEESDLFIVFPENFDDCINDFNGMKQEKVHNVNMYYNSASTSSVKAYSIMENVLLGFEQSIFDIFSVNGVENEKYDLASKEGNSKKLFASLIPMLLLAFIISGCVSIASESIAGEKERGTLATMLVTPVNRSSIAIGKVLGLSIIGLVSGVSVFLGLIFSLPQLTKGISEDVELDISIYGIKEYLTLLIIIISSILLFVSIISVISAFSRSVKEANMMSSPLTLLSVVVSLPTMAGGSVEESWKWYFVPVYNSVQCMNGVLNLDINYRFVVTTVLINLIITLLFVGILAKIIGKEKVVFN